MRSSNIVLIVPGVERGAVIVVAIRQRSLFVASRKWRRAVIVEIVKIVAGRQIVAPIIGVIIGVIVQIVEP